MHGDISVIKDACCRVVKSIATTTDEHPHPPKVIFVSDKKGTDVAHNPSKTEIGRPRRVGATLCESLGV